MQPFSVHFSGPSGAGKGTQVQLLIDELKKRDGRNVIHMDMGALLREQVADGGYTSQLTNDVISNGKLMPAFMPIYLMAKCLVQQFTGDEHIVADSIVRRIPQAEAFDEAMRFYGRNDYQIISIELSEDSIVKRLLLRARNDDTEEKIRNRISWYKEEVMPSLKILEDKGVTVHRINGEPDVDTIHKDILTKLGLS